MIHWVFGGSELMLRMAGAAVVSFLVVLLAGPRVIRYLARAKLGDRPEFNNASLNDLMRHKSNVPTMGGVLIVLAIFVAIMLFGDVMSNMYIRMALVALIWLGALGGADDWLKLRRQAGKGDRDGLKSWEKLLFQIGLAVLLGIFMYRYGSEGYSEWQDGTRINPAHMLYLPPFSRGIPLSPVLYVLITMVTMVGFSNAVNLTDGMDGLASGCTLIVAGVFLVLSWIVGVQAWARYLGLPTVVGSQEMTIVCAAIMGSCLGFLWHNANPAHVFMGDTGSLPLGGLLGYIAVVTRQEALLLIAGGVFVMEAGSVMLQVGYFKWTKRRSNGHQGRRIFRCAPLHHHFHLGGWPEPRIVVRMWVLGLIFAVLALATIKLRF